MKTAREILTKIKHDPKWAKMDYSIEYWDRIENKNKELSFSNIIDIGKIFLEIKINDEETSIPLHRLRKIYRNEKLVWEKKIA